ncbi:MAG: CPCC family cysteine-rich protein [bacterium]|nr:CPCC family cysteine-rich protein [bacterium]
MDSYKRYQCACCRNYTLEKMSTGTSEVCSICGWKDDQMQYDNPDYTHGANELSLNQARMKYFRIGKVAGF